MATPAQIAACVANAQHSTGPRSPEGKAVSSRNSLKLGLYSLANVLPGEDPAAFDQLLHDFEDEFHPEGPAETRLVHELVHAIWLERRYTRIETEVIKLRFASLSPDQRELGLGAIYIQDAEGLNVLHKIERRRSAAHRQARNAIAEIRRLQNQRLQTVNPSAPAMTSSKAKPAHHPAIPSIRFDDSRDGVPDAISTPVRTPSENRANPALRL
jgi:hypothetical protein